ncbi:MAG: hypothetical protein WC627_12940 [Legionella sp.]|jgi:hypothetical protein
MKIKAGIAILGLICSNSLWAFNCFFTLVKDNCWFKYNVTVDVVDANKSKTVATITVPAGQSWARQSFACDKEEKLLYKAHFSPVIWESERGKEYMAHDYWSLPATINPNDKAWDITVCYAADFSETPMPPEATGTCVCDKSKIPAVPPQ